MKGLGVVVYGCFQNDKEMSSLMEWHSGVDFVSILFCRHTIIYIHVERVRIPILRHVEEMIDYSFCFVRNEDISIYEGVLRVLRM